MFLISFSLGQNQPKIGMAHVSLFFIGLMLTLPFLFGEHWYPLTSFYQEWGAALFGLCATPLLATQRYWQQPKIPRIVLLPIGFLLLLWLQFFLGKVAYLSQTLLVSLYLLWAALLIMLGQRLREELGLRVLVTVSAAFLLFGGELSAIIGIAQKYEWSNPFFDYVVAAKHGGAVVSNLGQPNHLADYTSLALISLGLLYSRRTMHLGQAVFLAVPLLFVLVLSGSRSALFYLLTMVVMAFLWQRRDKANQPLLFYSLLLVLGFCLMHFAVKLPFLGLQSDSVTIADRVANTIGLSNRNNEYPVSNWSNSTRLNMWHEAWLVFTQFPVLGAGFGQFGFQHFQLGAVLHNVVTPGGANHVHNILLETAAEMGLVGLLILLGNIVPWLLQTSREPCTIYQWWGGGIFAVLSIHSMLEYPLFYAYFLGLAALVLGVLSKSDFRPKIRSIGRFSVSVILVLAVLSLSQLWKGYRILEAASIAGPMDSEYEQRLHFQRVSSIQGAQTFFFQHYIELDLCKLEGAPFTIHRAMNERVLRFSPISPAAYREVNLLAEAGKMSEAKAQLERAIWTYPWDFPANLVTLRKLADTDPDILRYSTLLEFGLKNYEEQQRAVNGQ